MIGFNPPLNPREATPKSEGTTDEAMAEYRETQVAQRASDGDEEPVSRNGATSPLIVYLVISLIEQDILLAGEIAWRSRDFNLLLRNMSLIHRSWTMPAQELLFRRVDATPRSNLIPRLLQHPFCSMIRELYLEMGMLDDDLDHFVLLLQRIPSLRKLSLSVCIWTRLSRARRNSICAKIYSRITPCLPNLAESWIHHDEIKLLKDCVKCMLRRGNGRAPFILKHFSVSDNWTGDSYEIPYESKMLLSPAQLHPVVHHKNPRYPFTYNSPQTHSSVDISECSITVVIQDELQLARFSLQIFRARGLFGDFHPHISHFTFFLLNRCSLMNSTRFRSLLASFLGRCTSLARMNLFVPSYVQGSNQEMAIIPFSSISKSLQVLSVFYSYPIDSNAQERASRLERAVREMRDRDRVGRSSLERIEVTFCRFYQMTSLAQSFVSESTETALPEYLDPVRRMCRELDINLVCKRVARVQVRR